MNIYKGQYWEVIYIDDCQEFPGYMIISSQKESLSMLTNEEWVELGQIEKELERVCHKVLDSTMFNFACLMNNAHRDNEKPHVHFHFVPRYRDEKIILGKKYKDLHFGYNFWKWSLNKFKRQKDIFTKEEKRELGNLLKKEFKL